LIVRGLSELSLQAPCSWFACSPVLLMNLDSVFYTN